MLLLIILAVQTAFHTRGTLTSSFDGSVTTYPKASKYNILIIKKKETELI